MPYIVGPLPDMPTARASGGEFRLELLSQLSHCRAQARRGTLQIVPEQLPPEARARRRLGAAGEQAGGPVRALAPQGQKPREGRAWPGAGQRTGVVEGPVDVGRGQGQARMGQRQGEGGDAAERGHDLADTGHQGGPRGEEPGDVGAEREGEPVQSGGGGRFGQQTGEPAQHGTRVARSAAEPSR